MEEIDSQEPPPVQISPEDLAKQRKKRSRRWFVGLMLVAACACGGVLVLPAIFLPALMSARFPVKEIDCGQNMKVVAASLLLYASDSDGLLPPAQKWVEVSIPLLKDPSETKFYRCPEVKSSSFAFAMNEWLGGAKVAEITDAPKTILLYEPQLPKINAFGDSRKEYARPPRHGKTNNFAFLDGHVEALEKP